MSKLKQSSASSASGGNSSKQRTEINNNNYESDSDDESNDCEESNVRVGLVVLDDIEDQNCNELKVNRMVLRSPFFPCKVGGKPAWLDFNDLAATSARLTCDSCKSPLSFLLQIYAPINSSDQLADQLESVDNVFHRTIFVFICSSDKCQQQQRTIKVMRSQLPRQNEFYSSEPPPAPSDDGDEDDDQENLQLIGKHLTDFYKQLHERKQFAFCNVCGLPSVKRCAKCSICFYCSQEHQVFDWSKLNHKTHCSKYTSLLEDKDELFKCWTNDENSAEKYPLNDEKSVRMFPEYEIVILSEMLEDLKLSETTEKMLKIDEKKISDDLELNSGLLDKDLDELKETDQDKDFDRFKRRTDHDPTQVIRYERGGQPLWVTKHGKLTAPKMPPACENCGAKRIFEFQINPQLLCYLKLDESKQQLLNGIDWACMYVYTCSRSCSSSSSTYLDEFVYKQDFV